MELFLAALGCRNWESHEKHKEQANKQHSSIASAAAPASRFLP